MENQTFLDKIAKKIIEDYANNITNLTVVLPNKRAKIFLLQAIQNQSDKTIFAPKIISVEDFIQDIAQIKSIDKIELLFEFYDVYLSITEKVKQQNFEEFSNWATTLLQDFNEIDRYLLEPNKILKYIENIKEIEHWSVDANKKTLMIEKHLEFWQLLPMYYQCFYHHLVTKKIGYQGLIYREAHKNKHQFTIANQETTYIFAGFNALNKAEEEIFQYLLKNEKHKIFWDADQSFLNDNYHDAGLFLRRIKNGWKHFNTNTFDWIFDDFAKEKSIQVIGTAKTIGQAKIVGSILDNILAENPEKSLSKTAVVLGDENFLLPVLHALPESVGALNITMAYPSNNSPAQILISKLFKMHLNAVARNNKSYVFYHKDILDILTHPLVAPYINSFDLIQTINKFNFTFINHKKINELQKEKNTLFNLIFKEWNDDANTILNTIKEILLTISQALKNDTEEDILIKTFIFSLYKSINKISNYFENHPNINDLSSLHLVYKQVIDNSEVSFEGEPLNGLQIMGVLESRVLDFDTVIITSMNEGKLPAGKSQNSFIPYDVKIEYELPTFKEKDAIYTYHFYHLLQRAKNIFLIYNTESEGFDPGERSRFITQLEIENKPKHTLIQENYNPVLPKNANQKIVIPKCNSVMEKLKILSEKGFSPSALTSYIRNPLDFYYTKILSFKEVDEVEESIALNTLGTIIHLVLKKLYDPFIDKYLTKDDIQYCFSILDATVSECFKLEFKEGDVKFGRNLLAFEVAKRNVFNFLIIELDNLNNNDSVKIIALEQNFERILNDEKLPFPVKIRGSVDRIEERNGEIRIIDYKTGKVEKKNLVLRNWNNLTKDIKNDKIIQVLAYSFMVEKQFEGKNISAGIFSFKNRGDGFMPFTFKSDKIKTSVLNPDLMANYLTEIIVLLNEIFNSEIPFEEKL